MAAQARPHVCRRSNLFELRVAPLQDTNRHVLSFRLCEDAGHVDERVIPAVAIPVIGDGPENQRSFGVECGLCPDAFQLRRQGLRGVVGNRPGLRLQDIDEKRAVL